MAKVRCIEAETKTRMPKFWPGSFKIMAVVMMVVVVMMIKYLVRRCANVTLSYTRVVQVQLATPPSRLYKISQNNIDIKTIIVYSRETAREAT